MLLNMKDLLEVANEQKFAVPAFNIGSGPILNAVIECCEKKQSPVILAIYPLELEFQGDNFTASCLAAANKTKIPVAFHLDHGKEYSQIIRAVRDGFTSVMIDASDKSFDENIQITRSIVELVHPLGISVEAELGTIGILDNKESSPTNIIYTNPEDAKAFVEQTGIDALAVAIGTAHGPYPKGFNPKLRLDLLAEIKEKVRIPLVLHGGSANPDDEIAQSVTLGINKINISADIKIAFYNQLRIDLAANPNLREPFELYLNSVNEMKKVINHKIDLFNAAGKSKYYSM